MTNDKKYIHERKFPKESKVSRRKEKRRSDNNDDDKKQKKEISDSSFKEEKITKLRSGHLKQYNTSDNDNNNNTNGKRTDRRSSRPDKDSKRRRNKNRGEDRKISPDSSKEESRKYRKRDPSNKLRNKDSSYLRKKEPKRKSESWKKEEKRSSGEDEETKVYKHRSRKTGISDSHMMRLDGKKKKTKDSNGNTSLLCSKCFQKFHDQRLVPPPLNGSILSTGFCQGINQPMISSRGGATKNNEVEEQNCSPCKKRYRDGAGGNSPRSRSVDISSRPATVGVAAGTSDRCPGVPPEWIVGPWPAPCSIAGGLGKQPRAACECGTTGSSEGGFLRRVLQGISTVVRPALPEAALGAMAALAGTYDVATQRGTARYPVNVSETSDRACSSFCTKCCKGSSRSTSSSSSCTDSSSTSSSSESVTSSSSTSSGRQVTNDPFSQIVNPPSSQVPADPSSHVTTEPPIRFISNCPYK